MSVLLSVEDSGTRALAKNGEEILVLSGSGGEGVVDVHYEAPKFKGAVIVCDGAVSSKVKLDVLSAVSAFTGLTSREIQILPRR